LDDPAQRARMIDANHMEMVKFAGKNDNGYKMVKADIEDLISKAENTARVSIPSM
jgi:hypothetical protein